MVGSSPPSELDATARRVREQILRFATRRRIHVGAAMSAVEILVAVHFAYLRQRPSKERGHRDRCILSKGHGVFALYGTLLELGVLPREIVERYGEDDCVLAGHPVTAVPGVEIATGALGHGLSVGAGLALAAAMDGVDTRTVVVLGDGELDEGSVWEALAFVAHRGLTNIVAIVDANGLQQEGPTARILDMEPLVDKFRAFRLRPVEVDGHRIDAIVEALQAPRTVPTVLVARTVKGHGVSFMENSPAWHMNQLDPELYAKALRELGGGS